MPSQPAKTTGGNRTPEDEHTASAKPKDGSRDSAARVLAATDVGAGADREDEGALVHARRRCRQVDMSQACKTSTTALRLYMPELSFEV